MAEFFKVKCEKCHNEQVIFSKASIIVKCIVCGTILAEPTGGVATLKLKPIEVYENK